MKHSPKIVLLLLGMFLLTQLIGIAVIKAYSPEVKQTIDESGNLVNTTDYNLPYGLNPPEENNPKANLFSIMIAIAMAVTIILLLMKFKSEIFLRYWFFVVVLLALGITLNSLLFKIPYSSLLAILLAIPLAFFKIFRRNIIIHNLTELMIYPGISVIFVSLLNVWTVSLLLVIISIYDMYAVWYAGFMQKMARYQIEKVRVFSGFFVPYLDKKNKDLLTKIKKGKSKAKKVKIPIAILGGGDVLFPIILAGVVLREISLFGSIIIAICATLALGALFLASQKGKFYPAMPFISAGCFVGLALAYLVNL